MLESNLGNHKNLFPHIGNHQYPMATDSRNHAQTIAMSFNFSLQFFLAEIKCIPKSLHTRGVKTAVIGQLLNILVVLPFPLEFLNFSIDRFYTIKTMFGRLILLFFYSNSLIKGTNTQAYLPKTTAILPRQFKS
jgi:hypothetical protein